MDIGSNPVWSLVENTFRPSLRRKYRSASTYKPRPRHQVQVAYKEMSSEHMGIKKMKASNADALFLARNFSGMQVELFQEAERTQGYVRKALKGLGWIHSPKKYE